MLNGLDVTLNAAQGNRASIFLFSFVFFMERFAYRKNYLSPYELYYGSETLSLCP